MKTSIEIGLSFGMLLLLATAAGQTVNSDSWAATDALGRKVCEYGEAGDRKKDKFVAMFYWTWHQMGIDTAYQVKNITEIIRRYPEAMKDYNHPAWGTSKPGLYYWEQPLLGYYKTTDPWVLRKHAEMLADAGVDAVFFDCTNGSQTWRESYEALMKTWDQAQKDGVKVPKIAFMLPFAPVQHSLVSLRQLYEEVYEPEFYKNLWFMWEGKPCIMAYPDNLTDSPKDKAIAVFFTFRPPQAGYYTDGPIATRYDEWSWLQIYPQHGFAKKADGTFEQISVGVAQNTSPDKKGRCGAFNVKDAYGRNFSVLKGFDPRVDGYLYGWNFQEQWNRALELDPELVFVTGWNEYIAGMHTPADGWNGFPFSFVDQYNWNCSRDIEPNAGWGDKGDVYYLQLVDNVRKFKGMTPPEKASAPKTVKIGKADGWDDVAPYFASYKGNTMHRDHRGCYNRYYVNNTGRNDIVGAKVARDADNVYFYVETADKLTPATDRNWMMLFIDVVAREVHQLFCDSQFELVAVDGELALADGFPFPSSADVLFDHGFFTVRTRAIDDEIVSVPSGRFVAVDVDIEFKWNDNMQENGNIMDFYVNGDTAPGGRFNYVYTTK